MIRVRCPICSKSFEISKLDDLPSFPFCTDRCRMVDLGRWIDGVYALPDDTASGSKSAADLEEDEDD